MLFYWQMLRLCSINSYFSLLNKKKSFPLFRFVFFLSVFVVCVYNDKKKTKYMYIQLIFSTQLSLFSRWIQKKRKKKHTSTTNTHTSPTIELFTQTWHVHVHARVVDSVRHFKCFTIPPSISSYICMKLLFSFAFSLFLITSRLFLFSCSSLCLCLNFANSCAMSFSLMCILIGVSASVFVICVCTLACMSTLKYNINISWSLRFFCILCRIDSVATNFRTYNWLECVLDKELIKRNNMIVFFSLWTFLLYFSMRTTRGCWHAIHIRYLFIAF